MFDLDNHKKMQINQILHLVKIASLAFPSIAFFQYYSRNLGYLFFKNILLLVIVLITVLLTYTFWNTIQARINDQATIKVWIDPVISLLIAFLSVLLTGAYESSYKFLFLFVIISSSIECSINKSLIISGISAAIVLAIDLIFAPSYNVNPYFECDLVLVSVFMIISWTIGFYVDLEKKHIESLNNIANTDGLTGLYNHRFFYDCLSEHVSKSKSVGAELSLLFIDIDDFKYYNDLYGHQKGDEVLRSISSIMSDTVVDSAHLARYGGEEFAILLPGMDEEQAIQQAEKLRSSVQEHYFEGQNRLPGGTLTISIGVSTFPLKANTDAELLKSADDACYRAKFLRKNRVEAYYSILDDLQLDFDESSKEIVSSIKTLNAVINAKDKYTYRHVERVVYYCNLVSEKLWFSDRAKKSFICAAYLHDIGKINIPEEVLMKPNKLTPEEWEIMRSHPQNGAEIIRNVHSLSEMVPIILQHHERYDGTGYPNNLKGAEINYFARILTVIDSFDAMTSVRPYHQKKSFRNAIDELKRCSGTQFDPESVQIFLSVIDDIETVN